MTESGGQQGVLTGPAAHIDNFAGKASGTSQLLKGRLGPSNVQGGTEEAYMASKSWAAGGPVQDGRSGDDGSAIPILLLPDEPPK